jgi:hypothetical protein
MNYGRSYSLAYPNRKTAKALGITFPPTIMVRAEQMIQ